jgi:ABC-2 type transport system ATP-binding protein
MLINAENLSLTLDGFSILHSVQLHLESNQIYGLLGPNGAGKSTTIAVILGLYDATQGTLELFGQPANHQAVETRRRIGVMPEHAGFYDWMSAGDYLAWYAGLYGGSQRPIPELLVQVGLNGLGDRKIVRFSHGMRQRLGIARALVNNPKLLILDEPTNGLDPRGRREIHDLLLSLAREQGMGILLCTHLLDDVDRLCDRIGIIHQGRTTLEGSLVELLGRHGTGCKFRLRLETNPEIANLPDGIEATLLSRDGGWWHLHLDADANPADLWQKLLARGWRIREIHAEGGGIEELYLRMTRTAGQPLREVMT